MISCSKVLTDGERSTTVNEKVRKELSSLVDVEKVTWKGIGLCENFLTPLTAKAQSFKPVVGTVHIDNIAARVGELKVFKIPEVNKRVAVVIILTFRFFIFHFVLMAFFWSFRIFIGSVLRR